MSWLRRSLPHRMQKAHGKACAPRRGRDFIEQRSDDRCRRGVDEARGVTHLHHLSAFGVAERSRVRARRRSRPVPWSVSPAGPSQGSCYHDGTLMKYKPTTVYLDPEDHARLTKEAAERGISLAELLRRITSSHVSERSPAYGGRSWDAIIGVATTDEQVDDAAGHDEVLGEAMEDPGTSRARPTTPSRRSTRPRRASEPRRTARRR